METQTKSCLRPRVKTATSTCMDTDDLNCDLNTVKIKTEDSGGRASSEEIKKLTPPVEEKSAMETENDTDLIEGTMVLWGMNVILPKTEPEDNDKTEAETELLDLSLSEFTTDNIQQTVDSLSEQVRLALLTSGVNNSILELQQDNNVTVNIEGMESDELTPTEDADLLADHANELEELLDEIRKMPFTNDANEQKDTDTVTVGEPRAPEIAPKPSKPASHNQRGPQILQLPTGEFYEVADGENIIDLDKNFGIVVAPSGMPHVYKDNAITPGISQFKCSLCSERFARKLHLNSHMEKRHGVKFVFTERGRKVKLVRIPKDFELRQGEKVDPTLEILLKAAENNGYQSLKGVIGVQPIDAKESLPAVKPKPLTKEKRIRRKRSSDCIDPNDDEIGILVPKIDGLAMKQVTEVGQTPFVAFYPLKDSTNESPDTAYFLKIKSLPFSLEKHLLLPAQLEDVKKARVAKREPVLSEQPGTSNDSSNSTQQSRVTLPIVAIVKHVDKGDGNTAVVVYDALETTINEISFISDEVFHKMMLDLRVQTQPMVSSEQQSPSLLDTAVDTTSPDVESEHNQTTSPVSVTAVTDNGGEKPKKRARKKKLSFEQPAKMNHEAIDGNNVQTMDAGHNMILDTAVDTISPGVESEHNETSSPVPVADVTDNGGEKPKKRGRKRKLISEQPAKKNDLNEQAIDGNNVKTMDAEHNMILDTAVDTTSPDVKSEQNQTSSPMPMADVTDNGGEKPKKRARKKKLTSEQPAKKNDLNGQPMDAGHTTLQVKPSVPRSRTRQPRKKAGAPTEPAPMETETESKE